MWRTGGEKSVRPHPRLSLMWTPCRPRSQRGDEPTQGRAGPSWSSGITRCGEARISRIYPGECQDITRGYGPAMHQLLPQIRSGKGWRQAARNLFGGRGSVGDGGARRVAPLGAYFADELEAVVEHARRSAQITHAHPEGIAGAIAVAVGAAQAWRASEAAHPPDAGGFLDGVGQCVPESTVR